MKILEMCMFSAGIDGVFTRVREEAIRLSKNNEVRIFSSNITKGTNEIAPREENIGRVKIRRFPAVKLGGESYMAFDSSLKQAITEYKPKIIIAHSYRHTHTHIALSIGKKIGAKVILVSHGPFGDSSQRSFLGKISVWYYDKFIGPEKLKKFDKVVAVTKWEIPYLKKLCVSENQLEYIPNGIPEGFFSQKKGREENKVLFLGRIAQVKDVETLIRSIKLTRNYIRLEIVGPAEKWYLEKLKRLIDQLELKDRVEFSPAVFDIKEKIAKIDSSRIFVLPSKREAMPQSLIEAMARKKIVIASDTLGAKDLIKDGENGFLFKIGDSQELADKIDLAHFLDKNKDAQMRKSALNSVKQFSWDNVIKKIERLVRS
jgi:glycosyltransferase involved in cell wall biosynthesis